MKVCEKCGDEIATKDGDNECPKCERKEKKNRQARARRKQMDDVMRSCNLTRVRGALGGIYYE